MLPNKKTAVNLPCRGSGYSLAWISTDGRISLLGSRDMHSGWAKELLVDGNETLLEKGWVRVSNIFSWQMYNPSPEAVKAAVAWVIHCAVQSKLDLDRPMITLEGKPGKTAFLSVADFVRKLGGVQAENQLFRAWNATWFAPSQHVASASGSKHFGVVYPLMRLANTAPPLDWQKVGQSLVALQHTLAEAKTWKKMPLQAFDTSENRKILGAFRSTLNDSLWPLTEWLSYWGADSGADFEPLRETLTRATGYLLDALEGNILDDDDVIAARFEQYLDAIPKIIPSFIKGLHKIFAQLGPAHFEYSGFKIQNPGRLPDHIVKRLLGGVNYLVALFKHKGVLPLLLKTLRGIVLTEKMVGSHSHGEYVADKALVFVSPAVLKEGGEGRLKNWLNEVFLHEVAHHIHLRYLSPEAKAVWGAPWAPVALPEKEREELELLNYYDDRAIQKALQEKHTQSLKHLQIPTTYGHTNENEDFAETFVAFMEAPQKLSETARGRMLKALHISGLYSKPVMRLAKERKPSTAVSNKAKKIARVFLTKSASSPLNIVEQKGDQVHWEMDLDQDHFVHFTSSKRASEILASGKLLYHPPYKKFGIDKIGAISLVWGAYAPGVQTTHIQADKEGGLVAVMFKTDTKPGTSFPEEVLWDRDVVLKQAKVLPVSMAVSLLQRAPLKGQVQGFGHWVTYH